MCTYNPENFIMDYIWKALISFSLFLWTNKFSFKGDYGIWHVAFNTGSENRAELEEKSAQVSQVGAKCPHRSTHTVSWPCCELISTPHDTQHLSEDICDSLCRFSPGRVWQCHDMVTLPSVKKKKNPRDHAILLLIFSVVISFVLDFFVFFACSF